MDLSFKKQLFILYNEINKEIYSMGVQSQKINIIENQVLILAKISRSPLFSMLGEEERGLVSSLDAVLTSKFKQRLKEKLESTFDLKVTALFKDYDPGTESSSTVICFDRLVAK